MFDPKGHDADAKEDVYLQIVRQTDVVDFGRWDQKMELFVAQFGALTVTHPPAENLIASKLIRGDIQDIDDVVYLIARLDVSRTAIERAIGTLPRSIAGTARENTVFLDVLMPKNGVYVKNSAQRKPIKCREVSLGL